MNSKHLIPAIALLLLGGAVPAQAENLEHLQQLLSSRQCQRCDLSRAGLVFANLTGVDVSGADLSLANLNRANLSSANLRGTNLVGAVLANANLSGADLRGADLRGADLREAYLVGVNLDGANLEGANLHGVVGAPTTVVRVEDLYLWGLSETSQGNYEGAIAYFNQALDRRADFAQATLARGIARFQLGDEEGAIADGELAEQLYFNQRNDEGHQLSGQFVAGVKQMMEADEEARERMRGGGSGGNFMNFVGGLASLLLRFLL